MNNLTTKEENKLSILLNAFENAVAFDYGITPFKGGELEIYLNEVTEDEILLTMVSYETSNSEEQHENLSIDREKLNEWDETITDKTFTELIE